MKRGMAIGMVAVGLGVLCFALAGKMAKLRAENEALRAELNEQRLITAEFARSAQAPRRFGGGEISPEEKLELMRLRNEVTQLRASAEAAREAVKDALENRDVRMRQVAIMDREGRSVGGTEFRKEEWSFRGYATPEDALVSGVWALANGDMEKMMAGLIPDQRTEWEEQSRNKNASELRDQIVREFGDLTAIRITGERVVSPAQLLVDVDLIRPQETSRRQLHMRLINDEWKMQSLVNNPDPLAFYRKNPELMKRYFPHLFREGAQQQPAQQLPQAQPAQATMPPELMRRYGLQVQQQPAREKETASVEGQGTLPPEPSPNE